MLRRQTGAYRSLAPTFAISEAALILFAERYTSLARLREVCARAYCAWTMLTNKAEISSADASATIELMETQPQITLEKVLRVVGEFYAISKSDLCSDRRHRSVVHPRQVAMYIAKQVTGRSMHEIGRHTGNRDHSTVINGIKRVIRDMENNPTYKEEVDMLIARLKTM
jgi:chromosomal replication initiator protein